MRLLFLLQLEHHVPLHTLLERLNLIEQVTQQIQKHESPVQVILALSLVLFGPLDLKLALLTLDLPHNLLEYNHLVSLSIGQMIE